MIYSPKTGGSAEFEGEGNEGGSEGGGGDKWGWGEIIHEAEAIQVDKKIKKRRTRVE